MMPEFDKVYDAIDALKEHYSDLTGDCVQALMRLEEGEMEDEEMEMWLQKWAEIK